MLAKRISQLKPGDLFIWGNANTRSNMCVSGEMLGPLLCVEVNQSSKKISFTSRSGAEDARWYEPTDSAIVSPDGYDLSNLVHHDVECGKCHERYGRHNGVKCPDDRGTYFAPRQEDLENFHWEELCRLSEYDDFFDSIGL